MADPGMAATWQHGGLRWSGAVWVALFLLWLPLEDTSTWPAQILAALGITWGYVRFFGAAGSKGWTWVRRGLVVGLAVPILAVLLLVFKTGLHGHGFPELPLPRLAAPLTWLPVWLAAGLLFSFFWQRRAARQ